MKNNILFFIIAALLLHSTPSFTLEEANTQQKLRIQELFPQCWIEIPAIAPCIPSDYVAGSQDKNFDYALELLWGREEDVDILSKADPNTPFDALPFQSPVLRLTPSLSVQQIGADRFTGEEELESQAGQLGITIKNKKKFFWGDYPVLAFDMIMKDGTTISNAWVGLNSQGRHVLYIALMAPQGKTEKANKFWQRFLDFTTPLSEQELLIAKGMDMRDGYTLWSTATASMTVKAEKRLSDGQIAVLVEPTSSGTYFKSNAIYEGQLGTKWKHGQPCLKVSGVVTEKNGNAQNIIDTTITVLYQEVDEFSFSPNSEDYADKFTVINLP